MRTNTPTPPPSDASEGLTGRWSEHLISSTDEYRSHLQGPGVVRSLQTHLAIFKSNQHKFSSRKSVLPSSIAVLHPLSSHPPSSLTHCPPPPTPLQPDARICIHAFTTCLHTHAANMHKFPRHTDVTAHRSNANAHLMASLCPGGVRERIRSVWSVRGHR